MAPCQSAIRSNQHLSPCSLRGSHQTRLEWLRQVVDGTTFTPDVISIGLGPLEKELLGSFEDLARVALGEHTVAQLSRAHVDFELKRGSIRERAAPLGHDSGYQTQTTAAHSAPNTSQLTRTAAEARADEGAAPDRPEKGWGLASSGSLHGIGRREGGGGTYAVSREG